MNNETKSSKNKEAQEVQCTRVQQENTITHTSHWQVSIDLVSPLLLYNLFLKFLSFPSITSLPHPPTLVPSHTTPLLLLLLLRPRSSSRPSSRWLVVDCELLASA
jgi:hypothetical protein